MHTKWLVFSFGIILPLAFINCSGQRFVASDGLFSESASSQAGGDVGAQINAADATLGGTCGTIHVSGTLASQTVTTPVTLSPCHNLFIAEPLTWNATITALGNNHVYASSTSAQQTFTFTGAWLTATSVANLELDHVWATWSTILGANNGNRLMLCKACTTVSIHDNHTVGGGYIKTDSTASDYASVNSANSSSHIQATNNYVDGVTGPTDAVQAAFYSFTSDVVDQNVQCENVGFCRSDWGGNNNTEWTSYDPATLKAGPMSFIGGTENNTVAGDWWSMVNGITDAGVTVNGCADVCLDPEGSQNVVLSNFYATNATNGELSAFFHSKNVVFKNGTVLHTAPTVGFAAFTNNPSNDPTQSNDVTFDSINFNCATTATANCAMMFDPVLNLTLKNSNLVNTVLKHSPSATMAGNDSILNNVFNYTIAMTNAWNALDISTQGNYQAVVQNNQINNQVTQPAGTSAIYASNAYANSQVLPVLISGNTTTAWPVDLNLNVPSNTTSSVPVFSSQGNSYGSNSVEISNGTPTFFSITEESFTPASMTATCVPGYGTLHDSQNSYTCIATDSWQSTPL